ncbi:hypothetical protein AX769_20425 [Frondihabitans sp. PAMC 28766]|uniref:alpha/beta hydrolase family esterase n=1 Tax=Frondihabitans sp. PAMC 28766 TaxID=1795630 RepID=UPI00078B8CBE|nr:PHB depolymerase family esterase [Frondihabitans sp. PAMC 28766]AMM22081.1 hypothetical protein AX769_20425 [Frondihabitans sp. PAMC 28766]
MTSKRTIDAAGKRRTYRLTLPPDATPSAGASLLLLFHGSNQTAASLETFTGGTLEGLAAADGVVVASLDGYKRNWNDAREHSTFPARLEGYDDVAFAVAVIDELAADYAIDTSRVFAAGFSNGGALAIRLAHEIPDRLAGVGILSATMPVAHNFAVSRDLELPLPVIQFHGTHDRLVPYSGGMASLWGLKPRGLGVSARDTAAYFAGRNGISTPPVETAATTGRPQVTRLDYSAPGHAPVRLVTVEGGGHTIPGPKRAPRIMGATVTSFSAADELAAFFGLR